MVEKCNLPSNLNPNKQKRIKMAPNFVWTG